MKSIVNNNENHIEEYNTEIVTSELLRISIKFLEICQQKILSGAIELGYYNILSGVKIKFINDIIEKNEFIIDSYLSNKINKLQRKHNFILNMVNA